jgi:hypothetical protein
MRNIFQMKNEKKESTISHTLCNGLPGQLLYIDSLQWNLTTFDIYQYVIFGTNASVSTESR